jgi:signal transduction histidine kinase
MPHAGRSMTERHPVARSPGRRGAEWLARLKVVTAPLAAALEQGDVTAALAAADLPGAHGGLVALRSEDGELAIVAARGAAAELHGALAGLAVSPDHVLAVAVRDARPRFAPGLVALPLLAGDRVLGALGLVFAASHRFGCDELAFLEAFAAQGAQALVRARHYEAERAARVEAQRAEEAARRAVELQERLVSVVGHDLRTPLAAVHMATTLLARRARISDDEARTLRRIAASVARMTAIVRDLLDFSRIRREGTIPLERRPTDLAEAARAAVAELQGVHAARDITLDARGPAPVVGDPERLAQVVSNLVGNAVQHGAAGASVVVSVGQDPEGAVLEVHNAGPPIPPALLAVLFEPFRRGPGGPDPSGSIGLGLFIVRELVRAHGGDVTVRSVDGQGTTFTVRLPDARAATSGGPSAED